MEWNILDYATVEAAYRNVTLKHTEMIALGTGLGLVFAIFNLMRVVKEDSEKVIDVAMIFKLIKENASVLALILFLPVAIVTIEEIFAIIQKAYVSQLGDQPKGEIYQAELNELDGFVKTQAERYKDASIVESIGIGIMSGVEQLIILAVKPFMILLDNWSYGFALVYRFIFLGVLKMTGGLAVACYIYEPTRSYFYTWVKNLAVCYLLIPGFLFVTAFVDGLREQFWGQGSIQLGIVILCVLLKLFGYATVQKLLHKAL